MKLTKQQLKQLIKEEIQNVLSEGSSDNLVIPDTWTPSQRSDRRALKVLRKGKKWGATWNRCMRGRDIFCSEKGFSLKIMGMGSTLAIYVYQCTADKWKIMECDDKKVAEIYVEGSL
jgi:hypothetical protein